MQCNLQTTLEGQRYWITYNPEQKTINLPATGPLTHTGVKDLLLAIVQAMEAAEIL